MPEAIDLKEKLSERDQRAAIRLGEDRPKETFPDDTDVPDEVRLIIPSPAEINRPINMPSAEALVDMESVLDHEFGIFPEPKDSTRWIRVVPKNLVPYHDPTKNTVSYKYWCEMTFGVIRNREQQAVAHKPIGEKMIPVDEFKKNYRPFRSVERVGKS